MVDFCINVNVHQRNRSGWVKTQESPRWVEDGAYTWSADPEAWPQIPVFYLSDESYDYRVQVEGVGNPGTPGLRLETEHRAQPRTAWEI